MSHLPSRRVLLRACTFGVGSLAGGALLAACGGGATGQVASTSAAAPPATAATVTAPATSAAAPSSAAATTAAPATTLASQVTTSQAGSSSTATVSAASKSAAASGKIRFSYTPGNDFQTVYTKLASQFQAQNPGTQVAVEGTWNWDNNKYLVQASGGDAADVVWSDETYAPELYVAGATRALDDFIAVDHQYNPSDYFPNAIAALKFQGKQIGLVMEWGAYILWYNKSLFDQMGQKPPDATWTWDKFLSTAQALTKPSSDPQVFGQYGFETRNHQNVWSPWIWGAGGDLFSADGLKCTMDSPEAIAGIQYWLDLVHKSKVAPTAKELSDRKLGSNAFGLTGKIGMVFNAIYYLPTYSKATSFEWDIAPMPQGPKAHFTTMPTDALAMWKETRSPDTAWTFMRYLVSEEAEKLYVTGNLPGMPAHKAAADLILKQSGPPASKQVFYDAFQYAKPAFTTPYGQNAINVLQDQGKFGDMWTQGLPARDVLTAAMPTVNAAMQTQINAKK
jgi:multiple sugar transport system substrate-binding protein